ncbi:MAG TPA: response regulator [Bacteroidales bacterium]|nr:response regulator [Bacteroidales bacterium]
MKKRYQNYIMALIVLMGLTSIYSCTKDSAKTQSLNAKEISLYLYSIRRNEDSLTLYLNKSIADNNQLGKLYAYRLLGNYQRENARFTEAISSHQSELEAALKLNDTIDIIQALNNLGTDFRRVGALTEASDYHYRALDYAETYSGLETNAGMKNRVVSLNGIGNVSLSLGYYDEAKKYFEDALKDEIKLGSPIGQAINYANIGAIYEHKGEYDSARVYYEQSLEQNMIGKSNLGIGLCYIHFGNIFKQKAEYDEAKAEYQKAYELMENISDRWHWLEACISIAEINFLTKDFRGYKHYIELAEEVANEIESPEHLSAIYGLKHEYELSQNNFNSALYNYKKSIAMQDSVQGIKKNSQYLDLRVSYERSKFDRSLRQMEEDNRAENARRKIMLYALVLASITGIVITSLLYYAYRQRTKSNEILRRMERTRSEFFTGITHEFRTPLTVILGLAEKIQGDENSKKDATAIIRQGNILLDMVNQLLEMAKIKTRIESSKWVNDDIVAHTTMQVEAFRPYASAKGTDLIVVSNERVMKVDFIPKYYERILVNLLSNGLKYAPQGGKIEIDLSHHNGAFTLLVSDNGEGISAKDLPHIFDEFYTGKSLGQSETGTGIGLALVQKMVEAMNGTIAARNRKDGGAEFVITMPVKQKFEVEERLKELDHFEPIANLEFTKYDYELGEMELNGEDDGPQHRLSILVVEDNADIQSYIGSLLDDKYLVRFASNGDEGINKASEFLPDLIITDLMMPVMDGFELSGKIRSNKILNHIPIIVISAKTDSQDLHDAIEAGADAYLTKPFNAAELKLRVTKLLEQRQILRDKYSAAMIGGSAEEVELSNEDRDFLNKVISIVYENITDNNLNVDFVADHIYMSRSQLNRKIRQITGYSISAFILHIRLEKSKRMLRSDNARIGDIAIACGFEDSNYYSRVFKQIYKVSPSQFRKTPEYTNQ